jgi:hypothetical protein
MTVDWRRAFDHAAMLSATDGLPLAMGAIMWAGNAIGSRSREGARPFRIGTPQE